MNLQHDAFLIKQWGEKTIEIEIIKKYTAN